MLDQRRPHIVLRERHPDLPQIARHGADQRDVAPSKSGIQNERIVAVVFGDAVHHHDEGGFERRLERVDVDRLAAGALQHHVVQPVIGGAGPVGVT